MLDHLSVDEARRIAAHAQLQSVRVPDSSDRPTDQADAGGQIDAYRHLLSQLGCIQLDTISSVRRAHELTMLARGATVEAATTCLEEREEAASFEFMAHAMSLVPVELWPYFASRRALYRLPDKGPSDPNPKALAEARAVLRDRGFTTVSDFPSAPVRLAEETGWGSPSEHKRALEWMLWTGEAVCADRAGFKRVYRLAEDTIPSAHQWDAEADECSRVLLLRAIKALGVATTADLADYFRMRVAPARQAIAQLALPQVAIEGWGPEVWIDPDLTDVPTVDEDHAVAVSLFDPLVWYRERLRRLHGHDWKIEIYVPQAKRTFGYYCLPIYVGARVPGRVALRRVKDELVVEAAEWNSAIADEEHLRAAVDDVAKWVGRTPRWDASITRLT
ncbi:DNA glycosylase AlkZ-like family protein [Natronoglycomyces albus]|uniref:YcaQ family DNA glycosylase n=1 Tax=Natronoglycomyces albus TaxID=2811108 RepID=A0A895XJM2_9ACTN|nr:crosslink repair DNA glycosylase YcaQ family protein [Natronoglycomyces albus]QSB05534.1 YcaQ family DNA glycosylase [Natronoglycomyces albus]